MAAKNQFTILKYPNLKNIKKRFVVFQKKNFQCADSLVVPQPEDCQANMCMVVKQQAAMLDYPDPDLSLNCQSQLASHTLVNKSIMMMIQQRVITLHKGISKNPLIGQNS